MSFFGTHKGKALLGVLLLGASLAWLTGREPAGPRVVPKGKPVRRAPAGAKASFDFYLLALSVHPAFCAEHPDKRECRTTGHRSLVIHGLWPENLEPRTYPHDCPAPALDLDGGLQQELADFMPGMLDGLHEHEWREHGGCSGLGDDVYFRDTLELARPLAAALSAKLTTLAGSETTPAELRETAELFQPGVGASFTLHCRSQRGSGGRPVLFEVRQCIDNDGPGGAPQTLLACEKVRRRDQGCGASFIVAGP